MYLKDAPVKSAEFGDTHFWTPPWWSCELQHRTADDWILMRRAEVKDKNRANLLKSLHGAARDGHHEAMKLLLEKYAEPETEHVFRCLTPLALAVVQAHDETGITASLIQTMVIQKLHL
ncbi:hypothetical protein CJF30_00004360 [Rutstroemia sp. NJR-2017a BBW]|nr:hypothetical protein CJF30_00004360 [Rutstroemia sp. NJR-2017a BBW]